jgi:hypothetical protein
MTTRRQGRKLYGLARGVAAVAVTLVVTAGPAWAQYGGGAPPTTPSTIDLGDGTPPVSVSTSSQSPGGSVTLTTTTGPCVPNSVVTFYMVEVTASGGATALGPLDGPGGSEATVNANATGGFTPTDIVVPANAATGNYVLYSQCQTPNGLQQQSSGFIVVPGTTPATSTTLAAAADKAVPHYSISSDGAVAGDAPPAVKSLAATSVRALLSSGQSAKAASAPAEALDTSPAGHSSGSPAGSLGLAAAAFIAVGAVGAAGIRRRRHATGS